MDKRRISLHNGNILTVNIEEDNSKGLLFAPIANREQKYKKLKVVEDGVGVKVDDILYVPLHSGTNVEIHGEDYCVVNVKDIILVI